jgi:stage II sporulation protein GA (sporulation sigma-E factor processing peptidase)
MAFPRTAGKERLKGTGTTGGGSGLVVYADLVFLSNLIIDGAVLLMTAWVRGLKPDWRRLAAAASIGAAYAALLPVPGADILFQAIVKIAMSLAMLLIAFGFGGLQRFVRNAIAFYGINFAAAGGAVGLHYLLQSRGGVWDRLWLTETGAVGIELQYGMASVLAAAGAALLLYRAVLKGRRRTERTLDSLAEVTVEIAGRIARCTGLIDTGNRLYDPLTRTPVMVAEASLWKDELPAAWIEALRVGEVERLLARLDRDGHGWSDRLRFVPFRGIGGRTRLMLALRPDRVRIDRAGRTFETSRVLVGLEGGELASDGSYRAIIHPSLLGEDGGG